LNTVKLETKAVSAATVNCCQNQVFTHTLTCIYNSNVAEIEVLAEGVLLLPRTEAAAAAQD
jgi:hypothetical protein